MNLPDEIEIELLADGDEEGNDLYSAICEYASDYITDKTGFCHRGFEIEVKITASKILYDTDE